jgi:hypothetical protein
VDIRKNSYYFPIKLSNDFYNAGRCVYSAIRIESLNIIPVNSRL